MPKQLLFGKGDIGKRVSVQMTEAGGYWYWVGTLAGYDGNFVKLQRVTRRSKNGDSFPAPDRVALNASTIQQIDFDPDEGE